MTMCTYFGTLKLIIMIILWTSICLQDAQAIRNRFEVVQRCPFNESEWKVRAAHTTCNGSESYHCLLTEGGVSLREQCTDASLFTSGFCPIFTNEGYLQWSACKDTACPTSSYRSDEVYQYQICYQKTDNPIEKNTEKGSNDSSSVTVVTIIIVAILLTFVLVSVLVSYRKNLFGFKDKVQPCIVDLRTYFQQRNDTEGPKDVKRGEQPEQIHPLISQEPVYAKPSKNKTKKEPVYPKPVICYEKDKTTRGKHDETCQKTCKLNDLLNYLVHILKRELSVNDLKENAVIHSKSINEHFSEPLIKDLQSLKDINDYSQLDTSLVLTFLRNFCVGITTPRRGWDYEPPDDETHVGADIERIRFMWNKYCDDDFEFKHLDDVYNRMKQKYGTVAIHGDDGVKDSPLEYKENAERLESMKLKLQSIKLNPDCIVKKGIVITDGIIAALKILNSRNVVILKGVIGCGKTYALKAIQNHFQEGDWDTEWVESENFHNKTAYERPTILLCDNFFGTFGSNVFSQDDVDKSEQFLIEIANSEQTKVVIVIHKHVDDEIKKGLKLNFLKQKKITVDMDKLSEAETLLIFKEQLRRGHCQKEDNNDCWFTTVGFQSVLDKLSKNQGHIGGPFLSLMYCNQHELFSDEAFSVNPVQTLVQHFQRMKHDSPTDYACLVYLMCVQEHNCEEEPTEWAGLISADISKYALAEIFSTTGYVLFETKTATLAHDILTTAIYKSAAMMHEYLIIVVQQSKIDMLLQLLRPPGSSNNDLSCDFIDVHKSREFKRIGKVFVERYASKYREHDINDIFHPLQTLYFIREKYLKYLRTPDTP
ncbi:uncharacterized protein LOC128187251 [Crassostrea angulata]|uniref:uncharacterized protein LOC128187251 n=1 Tax=Magallana angulata TaxID=2784310 RepID=UPI0022B17AF7|nr:uncharacterized protein LOC128187251 [Crassostrea angulata]